MDPEVSGSMAASADQMVLASQAVEGSGSTRGRRSDSAGEWMKFGAVVVVLLGTVLVIAVLRPLIFGQIVPAVMGTGLEAEPATDPNPPAIQIPLIVAPDAPASSVEPALVEEPAREEEQPASDPAADSSPTNEPPAEAASLTHTVQANETLTSIARHYGVTVEAIVTANGIRNPNRIETGTTLFIPAATSEN
jgi:LysM repeat protein